jgi:hypothetical protein
MYIWFRLIWSPWEYTLKINYSRFETIFRGVFSDVTLLGGAMLLCSN